MQTSKLPQPQTDISTPIKGSCPLLSNKPASQRTKASMTRAQRWHASHERSAKCAARYSSSAKDASKTRNDSIHTGCLCSSFRQHYVCTHSHTTGTNSMHLIRKTHGTGSRTGRGHPASALPGCHAHQATAPLQGACVTARGAIEQAYLPVTPWLQHGVLLPCWPIPLPPHRCAETHTHNAKQANAAKHARKYACNKVPQQPQHCL